MSRAGACLCSRCWLEPQKRPLVVPRLLPLLSLLSKVVNIMLHSLSRAVVVVVVVAANIHINVVYHTTIRHQVEAYTITPQATFSISGHSLLGSFCIIYIKPNRKALHFWFADLLAPRFGEGSPTEGMCQISLRDDGGCAMTNVLRILNVTGTLR